MCNHKQQLENGETMPWPKEKGKTMPWIKEKGQTIVDKTRYKTTKTEQHELH